MMPYTVATKLLCPWDSPEYWSGLPFSSPEDLLNPGMEPNLLSLLHWQVGSLPLVPLGKPALQRLKGEDAYPINTEFLNNMHVPIFKTCFDNP